MRSVQELIAEIKHWPRENPHVHIDADSIADFTDHYYLAMYAAVAQSSKNSFSMMKTRLSRSTKKSFLYVDKPFFDVEVDLKVPHVVMSPSLDEVQEAINTCAKKVRMCTCV